MMVPETHLLYKEFNGVKRLAISYSQIDTFLTCPMKWYKTYVEGKRSTEKQEATSYGTVIHKTLEYFFKNGRQPSGKGPGGSYKLLCYPRRTYLGNTGNMMIAMKQSGELLAWIVDLFKKDGNRFMIADSDLNPCEKLIRHGAIVGVRRRFCAAVPSS